MRFIKPLDEELVMRLAGTHTGLVTIEENAIAGGAGSAVLELLASCAETLPTLALGIPDRFIEHGSREDCLAQAELDPASLEAAVQALVGTSVGLEDESVRDIKRHNRRAGCPIPGLIPSEGLIPP